MSYITQEDLEDELGLDTLIAYTDNASTGEVGEGRVNRAIGYAQGMFDSYARTRYTLPVPVTQQVKSICIRLAVFNLVENRSHVTEGRYEIHEKSHNQAMSFLKDLSAGKAGLDVPAVEETVTNPGSPDEVLRGSSKSSVIFSDEKLNGY